MRVIPTAIPEVLIVESPVYRDTRGCFIEIFHDDKFAALGLPTVFAQDNHSSSVQHTLRGLHYQLQAPQGKLVRTAQGTIFDVAVDLRRASPTFGQWVGVTLSADDGRQLWIPPGFAHGFVTLSEHADVSYKCTTVYHPTSDCTVAWNDPDLAIDWPLAPGVAPLLSPKDHAGAAFATATVFA